MRSNYTQLYVHCIWATWDRLPLIIQEIEQQVYAAIISECQKLKCTVIAVGGIENHVHLLTGFAPTLNISYLIKQVKGSSSHFITHEIQPDKFFKWQGSYGAFTVSHGEINKVANYIRNQKQHHAQKNIISQWELNNK